MTTATMPSRVGRYEIVRRLGRSMTDVFLAIDTVTQRKAVLKLVRNAPDALTRLVLEAERRGAAIQQQLHEADPRVVEIYECGDVDGYFFVAMQYVEGRSLAETLEDEGRIDARRAARVAMEICGQLARFHSWHAAGEGPRSAVVHGDIKPSNVHLGPNDTVRLLDFGIAKTLREDRAATVHDFGSPSYCSPERLSTSCVDPQSDLWAVGATLYEMLAGSPPYRAESTRQLERLIQSGRPPRALPPECPRPLAAIVTKALAPDPARRYASAAEFRDDLGRFLDGQTTVAERGRRGWSANTTIEVARACLRRATHTLRWRGRRKEIGAAVAWFLTGMLLWVGGSWLWQARHPRTPSLSAPRAAAPAARAPVPDREDLREAYLATGRKVIESYRASSNPDLRAFDWRKAEACFERAAQMGAKGGEVEAGRALSRGYLALAELMDGRHPEQKAPAVRARAKELFNRAALAAPRSPEPHLALARLYVYSLPNLELAMREFRAAERLGARLGPREIEQKADAYRARAEQEVVEARRSRNPARVAWFRRHAAQDAAAARRLYKSIAGFHKSGQRLRELDRMEARRWR